MNCMLELCFPGRRSYEERGECTTVFVRAVRAVELWSNCSGKTQD